MASNLPASKSGLYADPREDWLALHSEDVIDPARRIVDPHHHLWDRGGQRYLIDELAADFPNLTILAAHPGYPWIDEMTAVALHKGNVYWELSGWAPKYFAAQLKVDIRARLKEKVMFGSDYPSLPYERILREWGELGYKDDVMEGIFHGNAERVLGL